MKNKGEILTRLLIDHSNCVLFLHNTRDKEVAEQIIDEGFRFENQLTHSTDRVNGNDLVEITYFLFQRKEYGSYTIVIAIPKATYSKYATAAYSSGVIIEDIITSEPPHLSDNDELIYIIPPQHILGFFNQSTGQFVPNPLYNINYFSDRA